VQLHQPSVLKQFEQLDARIVIISFAPLERLRSWPDYWRETFYFPSLQPNQIAKAQDPLRRSIFLADPTLSAYRAYGLGRYSVVTVYGPQILWQYAKWAMQGKKIKRPTEDPLQRGGDFVVGRDGRIKLAHTGRDQSERPSVEIILNALDK